MDVFVNFQQLINSLIPYFLRKLKTLYFLNALIKPLQQINTRFVALRSEMIFFLSFNAQIIYLEKYLNLVYLNTDAYPNNLHIVDNSNIYFDYYFNKSEVQPPKYFYNLFDFESPVYLKNNEELTASANYIVKVPTGTTSGTDYKGINFDENILINRIRQYNNAGKTFQIVYF